MKVNTNANTRIEVTDGEVVRAFYKLFTDNYKLQAELFGEFAGDYAVGYNGNIHYYRIVNNTVRGWVDTGVEANDGQRAFNNFQIGLRNYIEKMNLVEEKP